MAELTKENRRRIEEYLEKGWTAFLLEKEFGIHKKFTNSIKAKKEKILVEHSTQKKIESLPPATNRPTILTDIEREELQKILYESYSMKWLLQNYGLSNTTQSGIMEKRIKKVTLATRRKIEILKKEYKNGEFKKKRIAEEKKKSKKSLEEATKKDEKAIQVLKKYKEEAKEKREKNRLENKNFGLIEGEYYNINKKGGKSRMERLVKEYKRYFLFEKGGQKITVTKSDMICGDYKVERVG